MGQEASALPEGGGSTAERASPSTVASTSSSSQPDSVMTVATQPTSDEQLLNPEQLSALRYLSDLISKAEATAAAGGPVCADLPLLKYQYNEIRSTALAEQQERRFKAEQAEYQRRAMQLRQAYDTARTRTKRSDNGASNPAAKRSKRQAQEPVPATAMDISGTSYEAVVLSEQPKANPIVRATAVAASAPPAVQATIVHAVPAFAAAPASSGASSSSASAMSPSSFLTSSHSSCTSDASVDSGEGTRHHTPTYTAGTNEFVTPQQDQPSAGEVSAADLYPYTTANDPIFGEFVQFPSTPQWTEPNYGDGPLSPAPAWRESGQTFDDETLDEDDKVFMNELLNLPDDIVEEDSAGDSSTPVHRGLDAIERSQKFLSNYIQLGLAERIRADYESKRITAATARKLIVWALASLEPDDQTELITQFQRSIKLNDQETSFSSAAGTSVSHPAGAVHNPKTPDEGCIVLSLLPQVLAPPVVQPPPPPSASVSTTKYHVLPSTQHIDFSPGTSKMLTHCCSTPAERDPTAPPMPMLDLLASVGAFLSEMKEKIGIEMKPEMKVPELFGANVSPFEAIPDDPDGIARIYAIWASRPAPSDRVIHGVSVPYKERSFMLNKAYEKLLGYSQREARGTMDRLRPVPIFTHARSDHLIALHRIGMRMRLGHLAVIMAYVVFVHRDGSEVYARAHVCLPTDGDVQDPRGWTLSLIPLPAELRPPFKPGVDLDDDVVLYGYKPAASLALGMEASEATSSLQVGESY